MNQRTCSTCSTVFDPTHGRQSYCSPGCRKPAHAKVEKRCDQCGAVCLKYRGQQRYAAVYCGVTCRDAAIRQPPKPARTGPNKADMRHLRSGLRIAIEDGPREAIIPAVKAHCVTTDAGCWEWQRVVKGGYPEVRIGGQSLAVHRIVLEAKMGSRLAGQAAHHVCANTVCVNPEHLQPVTHAANTAEMLARNYMVGRIRDLESALSALDPNHELLLEVSVPH